MSDKPAPNSHDHAMVFVVDDDEFMRAAIRRLFVSNGIAAEIYASGMEFLTQAPFERGGCVILDVSMPGLNGLEVQAALKQRRIELPVIFLTASADVPIAVSAMREGAVDFLEKPFENEDLVGRVRDALERHQHQRRGSVEREEVQRRLASLTARERSVLDLVVAGQTNKEIARTLGASFRTIEIHRRHVMEKMAVSTLAELVRLKLLDG
jgi:FixJ family two-component response regulator